ncbi:trypsin alpha-3-like [Ceratitis capitata]|uniref:trypsin alpha-3-like n=1 Tax=Ceratitis capitata TaxID=7213 RepID=UPI00032A2C25|nr:trypsin alpha-3-like [Ceratitis capitata]
MLHHPLTLKAVLLILANAVVFTKHHQPFDGRIVGGSSTSIWHHSHQISLYHNGLIICGGSIVDTENNKTNGYYVVTAAHCVEPTEPQSYFIKYGITSLVELVPIVFIDYIIQHEKYNATTANYDIALIKLKVRLQFSEKVKPITLAESTPETGSLAIVTGWGTTSEGGVLPAPILQEVTVILVDKDVCRQQYAPYDKTDQMLCAGVPEGGKDACQGDSGGPLVVDGKLTGIVSWGIGCGQPKYPGVYCNVSWFRTWVIGKVQ